MVIVRIARLSALLGLACFLSACPGDPNEGVPQDILDKELAAFDGANAERGAAGLEPLEMQQDLRTLARAHSQDMVDRDFFGHENPDGNDAFDRMDNAGIQYNGAGENVARNNFADPVARAIAGWMESQGHRDNILRETFTHSGMGVATDGSGMYWFTQVFITESKATGEFVAVYESLPLDLSARS